jgi:hypothetical protein
LPLQTVSALAQATTVKVALALVTLPAPLLTMTRYWAPSSAILATIDKVAAVSPATFTPLRCHWYVTPFP